MVDSQEDRCKIVICNRTTKPYGLCLIQWVENRSDFDSEYVNICCLYNTTFAQARRTKFQSHPRHDSATSKYPKFSWPRFHFLSSLNALRTAKSSSSSPSRYRRRRCRTAQARYPMLSSSLLTRLCRPRIQRCGYSDHLRSKTSYRCSPDPTT